MAIESGKCFEEKGGRLEFKVKSVFGKRCIQARSVPILRCLRVSYIGVTREYGAAKLFIYRFFLGQSARHSFIRLLQCSET